MCGGLGQSPSFGKDIQGLAVTKPWRILRPRAAPVPILEMTPRKLQRWPSETLQRELEPLRSIDRCRSS